GMLAACLPSSHCGLSGVALRRVTVAIGLYSVRLSEGSGPASLVCCGKRIPSSSHGVEAC
ncbi:MAG: hypothetical protein ACLUTK_15190, partial [[Clostridium] leptum]